MKKTSVDADIRSMQSKGTKNFLPLFADSIKFLLPLFQLYPIAFSATEKIKTALKCFCSLSDLSAENLSKILPELNPEALNYINETIYGLQKMILIATVENAFTPSDVETFSKTFIKPALQTKKHKIFIEWEGRGATNFEISLNFPNPSVGWFEKIKAFRSQAVFDVAQAYATPANGGMAETAGYFAGCPVCRKIFQKNRKDQVYCSRKCLNVEMQRRNRAKES